MSFVFSHCPLSGGFEGGHELRPCEASVEGINEWDYLVIWNVEEDSILLCELKIALRSKYNIK